MSDIEKASLNDQLMKELTTRSTDVFVDYAEIGLDQIFNSEFLDEIPVIKTLAAMCRFGVAIKDRHFAKKMAIFLKEYRSGTIDEEKLREFRQRLEENEEYKNNVLEHIMIMLDRYVENKKAIIISNLLVSYINGKCSFEQFFEMSSCLDLIFISDCNILKEIHSRTKALGPDVTNRYINFEQNLGKEIFSSIGRLRANGFLSRMDVAKFGGGPMDHLDLESRLTDFGLLFCELGLGLS